MMSPLNIPEWLIFLFLAMLIAFLSLSILGIYFLISKRYDKITLVISASILFALIIPKSLNAYHWTEFVNIYFNLPTLIVLTLAYLANFTIINFIHKLFCKITR